MSTSADISRARLPWGPVSLVFFGLAFARTWLSLVFVDAGATSGLAPLSHAAFDVGYVLASAAFVMLSRRLVPYTARRPAYVTTLVGMLVPVMWFAWGESLLAAFGVPQLSRVMAGAAAILGGCAYASFLILNAEVFAGVSILRIVIYLAGGRALAVFMTFLLQGVDEGRLAVALLVLPVVAVALVRVAYGSLAPAERQPARFPRYAFPWKLIVLVAVFSFVYGLRQATLAPGAGQHSSLSTGIVMGAVFLIAYFLPGRVNLAALCRAPLFIMLCGLLLLPTEGLFGQVVSSYFVSISYTLMTFLVTILLYDMSKRTGVAIMPLVAAVNAMQAFVLLGNAASSVVSHVVGATGLAGGLILGAVACLGIGAAFVLLFSERELEARWGIKVLSDASLDEMARVSDDLARRCEELVRTYGLTPREEEVLRELARRRDATAVARSLMIAPGTLKAHTRHIYEKMNIHTREELYTLLGLQWGPQE